MCVCVCVCVCVRVCARAHGHARVCDGMGDIFLFYSRGQICYKIWLLNSAVSSGFYHF